ncbi:VTC domain-containing protein [Truncatella angustata]|uniref:VTC domain-containing protein n=1 Tax=Truncatella angustata TaxID=152316 RepID=A0A9P8ZZY8_9PEZI|nr:VTC domain-containing protein [Truncatella angustata]KAH6656718.1 VTC domain-containing protein [Truncatella angustata]
MRFGKTLRESTYGPWKDQYINYSKLKSLLREDERDDDTQWTEEDEEKFSNEIFSVELDKVAAFQDKTVASLQKRTDDAFDKLKEFTPSDSKPKGDIATQRLKELKAQIDSITNEVEQLKKYSSVNYTGFLKIVKKHDRKRGDRYKVRPLMKLRLSDRGLNDEKAYSPLLKKLSTIYYIIDSHLESGSEQGQALPPDLEHQEEVKNGERYTAHKFWIHPDNLLEVKTYILRRLPALVYSDSSAKELDGKEDPSITSLYFDNSKFDLYMRKVERQVDVSSLRLRWYGQLSKKPDIYLEQKIIYENGTSEEKKINIKDKYIKQFIDGEYKMEKTVQKMERQGQQSDKVETFKDTADAIQDFITKNKLEPVVRSIYTRTAFQKPADDRVRIAIDSDIAFVREDTLDRDRPCRDPSSWHRRDIDDSNMSYPFKNINQSEVAKFPFALLEIKTKEDASRRRPAWVEDLMGSHLVHSAPRFSKFVHGVASLFEDHVNNLPFWLSDLERDIRKSPKQAFDEEEQRKARRAEDAQVVGSFLGKSTASYKAAASGSYKPAASSPVGQSYLAQRIQSEEHATRTNELSSTTIGEHQGEDEEDEEANGQQSYGTLGKILPSFSIGSYARLRKDRVKLPDGVVEPTAWIKNEGELKVEPKVWLANERTFLKWQHISVLLGSLAVGLYTSAGENFLAECMGVAYVAIAAVTGLWGYIMFNKRQSMIIERSGKDFDNMVGPMVVSVAMMIALVLNFVFAYREAFGKLHGEAQPAGNDTAKYIVGEL